MARYKLVDCFPKFIPVVLDAQIQPGSFEYALDYLVDNEPDLSALHARDHNDLIGAPAYWRTCLRPRRPPEGRRAGSVFCQRAAVTPALYRTHEARH